MLNHPKSGLKHSTTSIILNAASEEIKPVISLLCFKLFYSFFIGVNECNIKIFLVALASFGLNTVFLTLGLRHSEHTNRRRPFSRFLPQSAGIIVIFLVLIVFSKNSYSVN